MKTWNEEYRQKEKQISEHLNFLRILNNSTENYLYLLNLQEGRAWIFGDIEKHFDLGEKIGDNYYLADQWNNNVHSKDRPFLLADLDAIVRGVKDQHNMDYRVHDRKGGHTWVNCQGTVQTDEDGKPFIMVGRISETAVRCKIDTLTGLFNMEQMTDDLSHEISKKRKGYLLVLGIDNMKNINTIRGRIDGDKTLKYMAQVLETLSDSQKLYRMGGDVFAVPMYDASEEKVRTFYRDIKTAVAGRFTVSGGAVALDMAGMDASQLIQYSEFVLGKTKKTGKNDITIFDMKDYRDEEASVSLLEELVQSIKNGCTGFSLVYQPQYRSGGYSLFGAEALLRYESPTRGRVFPDEFIPLLEQSELMYSVGLWVIETALEQCKKWRVHNPDFHMSVNMSYSQLSKQEIKEDVLRILEKSGLPGSALTIEVTESMQLQDYNRYNKVFAAWKNEEIEISVDDFGTGYSSLGYLKNLNIDEIKIDRCFVSGIHSSSYNYLLISNMVELASDSQIRVCCEGVEETNELQVLEELKPDLLQGYLFSRPCEASEFERLAFHSEAPEYQQYRQKVGNMKAGHISNFLNLQHKDILHHVNVGLWIIRISEQQKIYEMYTDEVMRRLLGADRQMTPAEYYDFWHSRVPADCIDYVMNGMKYAIETGEIIRLQYYWNHPTMGEIEICGAGVRTEVIEGEICIQGYHRIISGMNFPAFKRETTKNN